MKLHGNVEVSGITKIVFYNTGEAWSRVDEDDDTFVWVRNDRTYTHQEMMNITHRKINDIENYDIKLSGDTMNIVPKDESMISERK